MNSKDWQAWFDAGGYNEGCLGVANLITDLAAAEERAVPPERFHELLEAEARVVSLTRFVVKSST